MSSQEESLGPNLLDNPNCIADGQGEGEEPLYWTVEQGEIECNEPEADFMPEPIEGDYVFIDWEDLEPSTDESIVTQTVPVTGGSEYQFSVWVGSDEVDDDYAQFEVQFLDDGTPIEDGMIDSGEFQPEDHEEPDQFVETTEAPANADEAVVRIKLVNGGDFDLDRPLLWADDVRLQEFSDAPTAFDVKGVEMGIEQTLAPGWTLFDDEFGEDEDDRGFDDDAEISHFGGGDLGGSVTDNEAGDTATLAGGDLQVNADGSFSLTNPTQTGTFEFEYRLEYEGDHDDATVEIEVFDHELVNPLCEEWDTNAQDQPIGWDGEDISCHDLEDLPFTDTDHTAVGERSFTDNYISLDDEVHTEQTVYVVSEETYTVSGLYGTDSEDYSGTVEFEYLDSDGDVIADEGFTLEELQSESTTDFDRFTEITDAPENAKQATVRLTVVRPSGHEDPAGVYFDDLSVERGDPGDDPVNARDVETEVGIYHTFEPEETLFDDWGNGVDELGTPEAELVNFGGGDLSDDVTDHEPGEEVALAGGTLTVENDGAFGFEEPTETGTYSFEYEIENEHDSSVGTVEFWVRDSTLFDTDCDPDTFEAWDDVSPGNGNLGCIDPQRSGSVDPNGEQNPPVPPYAIGDTVGDGEDAIAEQTVPVRPGFTYELAGFVGTEETPEDSYVTLEIEYLDDDGAELSLDDEHEVDLSEMRSEGTTEFDAFADTTVAPEDATYATIRIEVDNAAEVDLGGDAYARAYADDLSFEMALVTVDGTVTDEATGEPIEDATVELEAGGGTVDDAVTGADGTYEFEEVDPDTTYELTVMADGYEDGGETVVVEGTDETHDVELTGSASVSGTVEDATLDGIPAVEVTVAGEQGEYTATTDEDGAYTAEGVAGTDEAYTVSADPGSWNDNSTTVTVGDGESAQADLTLTGPRTNTVEAHDRLFENAGEEYRIGNAAVVIEHSTYGAEPTFGETTVTTGSDGSSVDVALPTMPTHLAPGGTLGDDELRYTASADGYESATDTESLDFDISMRVTIGGNAEVSGTVVDEGTGDPIEDATVEIEYPSGEAVVFEDATDSSGAYTIEDVPGTGEEYELTVSVDGYESNATAIAVGDGENVQHDVELSGTASVSGSVEDTTFETGIEGVQIAVENGAGTYTTETDENGEYTVEGVAGTGETYTVGVDQEGWQDESTTETLGDGDDVTGVDFEITGDASDDITLSDWVTDEPLDGTTVRIEHETLGVADDAFTADEDGEMEIVVPGGFTYSYTFTHPGYDAAEIPLRSFDPGDDLSANYVLAGNAEITGQITDSQSDAGIEGVTVTAENGAGAYTATTDENGAYTVENVPGGHDYDVTVEADGYGAAVETDESVEDGATHDLDSELTGNGAIEGAVEDERTGEGVENADVTVVYPTGEEFTVADATDSDGEFTVEEVAGTGEEYTVVVDAPGYEAGNAAVTVDDGALADAGTVELAGNATVSGTVSDATFESGIEGIEVTVSGSQTEYTATTDESGAYTVENVAGTDEEYTVSVDPEGWQEGSATSQVGDGENVGVDFEITGTASDEVTVTDDRTGGELEGATVTVEHDSLGDAAFVTDANGEASLTVPGGQSYDYTVSNVGYESVEQSRSFGPDESKEIDLSLAGNASLSGQAADEVTGAGIEDATVTLEYPSGEQVVFEDATDAGGAYTIEDVPGTGEEYEIYASADGYESGSTTVTVGDDEPAEDVTVELAGNATVSGSVADTTFETGVEGAAVTVEGEQGEYAAETDEHGAYTVEDVAGTGEAYTVTVDREGWQDESTAATVEDGADVTDVNFEITGDASDEITLQDGATDESLEGASVVVEHETFGVAVDTLTTDGDGAVTVEVPGGFEYTYTFSKAGYDDKAVDSGELAPGESSSRSVALAGNAEITGQITDSENSEVIEGATVIAENGAGEYTATTDSDGTYAIAVPGDTDYEVTVEADGYETVTSPDESVADGATHTVDAELTGTATVSGTVADETFGTELEAVEVEISAGQTYAVETNADGEYTATVAGTGEQYQVSVTREGWDGESRSVELGDGDDETGVDFELAGDAGGSITVADAETGGPVDGATVVVRNDELGESESFETDSDGVAEFPPLPGGFTYEYVIEADGYEDGAVTDVSLASGETVDLSHELSGSATITGTVTDAEAGHPLEGAAVEAENGAGSYGAIADANGVYVIENVPATGESYDLHAEAVGYEDATVTRTVDGDLEDVAIEAVPRYGTIEGTVVDDDGDPISGATVTIENEYGVTDEGETDGDGEYVFEEALAEVEHAVFVEAAGHESNATTVSVAEGETATVDVTLEALPDSGDSGGSGSSALVEIRGVDAPAEVEAGAEVTVTVELENTGAHDVSRAVELRVGAGEREMAKEVDLDGGESKTVTFEFTAPERVSLYSLTITVEHRSSSTTLSVLEASPTTPTETPTATPTETPHTTLTPTPTVTGTPTATETPADDEDVPGFGAVLALVALLAAALLAVRHESGRP